MRRRSTASVAANPVLIGAATTLVVVVAVFLAYNANNGLPFVPTYELRANLPSAANLVEGNDVRIGGARVGVVSKIAPFQHKDGSVTALTTMKLQTSVRPLPKDTTILVRPRSALGLKYVQLTPGRDRAGFDDGATIPLANAKPATVEIDDVARTFDTKTREDSRKNLVIFGSVFAGRGADLNAAIHAFDPLTRNLIPVARNLSNPKTNLAGFVRGLARLAGEVAPVAEEQASMFRNLDTTFTALDGVKADIQRSISGGPSSLDAAVRSFRIQRPFLANTGRLMSELRPGVAAFSHAAPILSSALVKGTAVLPRTIPLNQRLARTLTSLRRFAVAPSTRIGLSDLTNTANDLRPELDYLAPVQTRCNYITLWFRNVSNLLSEGDNNGTWQRFIIINAPNGPNNEGGPANAPADGPAATAPANFFHNDPYPNVGAPGQPKECEAANEVWQPQVSIGNQAGNQGSAHDVTKIDKSRPGN